jgi:enoyl-CoA hydratase/carnithine racemase
MPWPQPCATESRKASSAFGADPNIDAIVLIGGGRTFIAGADIREFGKPPAGANLNDVHRHDGELPQDHRRRPARHALSAAAWRRLSARTIASP